MRWPLSKAPATLIELAGEDVGNRLGAELASVNFFRGVKLRLWFGQGIWGNW